MAGRVCGLVPEIQRECVEGNAADVGDCERGAIGGLRELCVAGGYRVGGGGFAGFVSIALLQWLVARVGQCEDAHSFAGGCYGHLAVCAFDDCGV